jgi:transcriptional repressor NrdR
LRCGLRFTTYERVENVALTVVKRDGRREPYDRRKVLEGMRLACAKRPISTEVLEKAVDEIEGRLFRLGEAEIPSRIIGEMVMDRLRTMDPVAYIRFASVYQSYKDLEEMREAIDRLARERSDRGVTVGPDADVEGLQ